MSIIDEIKTFVKQESINHPYLLWEDVVENFNGEIVHDEMVQSTRWSILHEIVMKFDDTFVKIIHAEGATEMQDSDSIVDELYNLELVEPYTVTITKYRKVN